MVSRLEFLAYSGLTPEDETLFEKFCDRINLIGLAADDLELQNETTRLRKEYRLKLPDAIIAATAVKSNASLITADDDFNKVTELTVLNPKVD